MLCLFFVTVVGLMLGFYHRPLTLQDAETIDALEQMAVSEVKDAVIYDFEIRKEDHEFSMFTDSICKLNPEKFHNEYDIHKGTKVLYYKVVTDSTITQYATLFEVEEVFMRQLVGRKLITVEIIK